MNYYYTIAKKHISKGSLRFFIMGVFMIFGLSVTAQTNAQGYFNLGAKEFVHSKLEKAIAIVDKGLNKYPNDENLNELRKKLEEEKKKKDQNKDKQNKKDQNKKDQENKDNKDQDNKDQDNKTKKKTKKRKKKRRKSKIKRNRKRKRKKKRKNSSNLE